MQRIWQISEPHTWFTDVSELQAPHLPSVHGSAFKLGINEGLGLLSSGLRDFSSWESVWEFPARSHSDTPLRSEDRKSTSVSSRMWSWAGSGLTHGFVPAWQFNRAYITPVTHLNWAFCRPTAPHTEKLFPSSLCCSMRPGTMQTTSSLTPSDAQYSCCTAFTSLSPTLERLWWRSKKICSVWLWRVLWWRFLLF